MYFKLQHIQLQLNVWIQFYTQEHADVIPLLLLKLGVGEDVKHLKQLYIGRVLMTFLNNTQWKLKDSLKIIITKHKTDWFFTVMDDNRLRDYYEKVGSEGIINIKRNTTVNVTDSSTIKILIVLY